MVRTGRSIDPDAVTGDAAHEMDRQDPGVINMYAHATRSIIGARDHQEDASAVSLISPAVGPSGGGQQQASGELLAVLADGMGGHVGGSLASNTACNRFIDAFGETVTGETYRTRLERALLVVNTAPIAHERSPIRDRNNLAERSDTIL